MPIVVIPFSSLLGFISLTKIIIFLNESTVVSLILFTCGFKHATINIEFYYNIISFVKFTHAKGVKKAFEYNIYIS